MDMYNRLNDLITITGRLIELLERENNALATYQNQVIHELLDEKAALSRVYETRFKSLADSAGDLAECDEKLREKLLKLAFQVEELMDENSKLLHTAIEANRRTVDLIAEAVRNQQPSAGTYGADAATSENGSNAASQRVALSLDQTL